MPKTLVTGGAGFIGRHIAHLLLERGDDVRLGVLAEDEEGLEELDCERVVCDVLDPDAVDKALRGVNKVFHAAGLHSVRPDDRERVFEVNVGGTKNVLEGCLEAGVGRVVHTSSAVSCGPAKRGGTADESQVFQAARLGIPYVNSMHEGEVEAMRLAARGLPVVCVNPSLTFGAGDYNLGSTGLVRSFLLGRVPVYTEGAVCVVDVRDVAQGHLLADEHGEVGQRYVLGGRNFTFDRLFADLGRMSGMEPPLKVPVRMARAAASVLVVGDNPWPLTPEEVQAAGQWWTYRSTKAKRELGFTARPHEETLEATVAWHLDREHDRIARIRRSQQLQYRVAGAALGALETAGGLAGQLWRGLPRPG